MRCGIRHAEIQRDFVDEGGSGTRTPCAAK